MLIRALIPLLIEMFLHLLTFYELLPSFILPPFHFRGQDGEELDGMQRDGMWWRGTGQGGEGQYKTESDKTVWGGSFSRFEIGGSSPFHQVPLRSF